MPCRSLHNSAIASVLGALDDKIEQNRRTARALEGLARAIFKAWFVDFEPVKAKAAGATAFPGMPPAVFDALPTRFVDSATRPRAGGVVRRFRRHIEVNPARSLEAPEAPYVDMRGMPTKDAPDLQQWTPTTFDSGMHHHERRHSVRQPISLSHRERRDCFRAHFLD